MQLPIMHVEAKEVAMIGTLAILGCIGWLIFAAVVIGSAVSATMQGLSMKAEEEAAEKQRALQLEAQKKSENRSDYNNLMQQKIQAKNQERLKAQLSSSIVMNQLQAKKERYKASRLRQLATSEGIGGLGGMTAKPTSHKYSAGHPATA